MEIMNKDSVSKNSAKVYAEDVLQKVLDILEAEDDRSFDEKKAEAIAYLQDKEDSLLAERLLRRACDEEEGRRIKERFWECGVILISDNVILRDVEEQDKQGFMLLQEQYAPFKSMLREEAYRSMLWNEHTNGKALMCSIIFDGTYVGYCGIQNIAQEVLEISVEILKAWTGKGIGYLAIKEMLRVIKERIGATEFRVRIDPGNIASQKLFEKLGAVPNGISKHLLYDKDEIRRCEEENVELIDEALITVAEKFGVEPRKLLSHVLEYKISVNNV